MRVFKKKAEVKMEAERLHNLQIKAQIASAVLSGLCANPDISADMDRRRITPEDARSCLANSAWKTAGQLMTIYTWEKRFGTARARKG